MSNQDTPTLKIEQAKKALQSFRQKIVLVKILIAISFLILVSLAIYLNNYWILIGLIIFYLGCHFFLSPKIKLPPPASDQLAALFLDREVGELTFSSWLAITKETPEAIRAELTKRTAKLKALPKLSIPKEIKIFFGVIIFAFLNIKLSYLAKNLPK